MDEESCSVGRAGVHLAAVMPENLSRACGVGLGTRIRVAGYVDWT